MSWEFDLRLSGNESTLRDSLLVASGLAECGDWHRYLWEALDPTESMLRLQQQHTGPPSGRVGTQPVSKVRHRSPARDRQVSMMFVLVSIGLETDADS